MLPLISRIVGFRVAGPVVDRHIDVLVPVRERQPVSARAAEGGNEEVELGDVGTGVGVVADGDAEAHDRVGPGLQALVKLGVPVVAGRGSRLPGTFVRLTNYKTSVLCPAGRTAATGPEGQAE
jgi:hypothetical protein